MKRRRSFLLAVLIGLFLSGCGAPSGPFPTPFAESMKGYELYSWQEGNQWKFSLLVGTNREKSLEEVKSADSVFSGVDGLIAALRRIPAGQYITWTSKETLSFPPGDIIEQIEKACEEQGLILNKAG